ncbi:uncharacterized protein FSUBG_7261 [Fusarium subglutinans]|uniref:Integral membrane protein n=1 Tax=Gibberella subglutinans TaxID=42677 RepID=A0A8H5PUR0_GIBSU|nr:uncharacterized protein FSUBG_7261 [Fusarium subglutinans]KAF5603495.1 integral membrane protein [Fusarium subglutinans]
MISEDIPSESNTVLIYAPSITFFIVTPIFILFRFWDRVARRSIYGFGRHIEALTTDDKLMALKLFYVAQIFYKLTCKPLRGAWDKSTQSTCIGLNKNWHANAGFSIGTDALILALSMQSIWISQLPITHKRALTMILTMGGSVDIHRAHDNSRSGN